MTFFVYFVAYCTLYKSVQCTISIAALFLTEETAPAPPSDKNWSTIEF